LLDVTLKTITGAESEDSFDYVSIRMSKEQAYSLVRFIETDEASIEVMEFLDRLVDLIRDEVLTDWSTS